MESPSRLEEKRILIIGCGNPSRRDDSVALYIVNEINRHLGRPLIDHEAALYGPEADCGEDSVTTLFVQQFGPELADMVKDYDTVVFLDAHTGSYAEDLRFVPVVPSYITSAFSHHLEPSAILALSQMLYGQEPQAFSLSVRGYDFEFGTTLSDATHLLADQAVDKVMGILVDHSARPSTI